MNEENEFMSLYENCIIHKKIFANYLIKVSQEHGNLEFKDDIYVTYCLPEIF